MGLTRKIMSMSTLGAVDFRSDKERTAAYTKAAKKQARQQTKLMKQQLQMQQQAANRPMPPAPVTPMPPIQTQQPQIQFQPQAPTPVAVPAGWYKDPSGQPCLRYWDGNRWTESTAPST